MGFAEGYLQKHAIGQPLIHSAPDPDIHSIIAIPAYNESGLHRCLDSLFSCEPPEAPVEVIVLINSGAHTPRDIIHLNRKTHQELVGWCGTHQRPGLAVHPVLLENLPQKHFGAGLARKLVMDEAVRRFNQVDHARGIILSLDADTSVAPNYLREVTMLFERRPETNGCSIRFAHPVGSGGLGEGERGRLGEGEMGRLGDGETGRGGDGGTGRGGDEATGGLGEGENAAVYDAIVNYELHQRYYLEAVRFTGYPYAFHTVGSAFAVRADAYCRQGGMSKRQAGEDFYFIQKIAMQGRYTECNTTAVYPSPRPSDRVPFGTGPAIARQLATSGQPYLTYAPELFRHLEAFYARIPVFYASNADSDLSPLPDMLQNYLKATGFRSTLSEIRGNVASEPSFRQRFFRKFNMFWILKYLHFAEEQGMEKAEIGCAAREMLEMKRDKAGTEAREIPEIGMSKIAPTSMEIPEIRESKATSTNKEMSAMKGNKAGDAAREIPAIKSGKDDVEAREIPNPGKRKAASTNKKMSAMKGNKAGADPSLRDLLWVYRKIQADNSWSPASPGT